MARTHHRKKHKTQVQQFKKDHSQSTSALKRSSSFPVFTIIAGLLGAIVAYIATNGTLMWVGVGLVAGALAGYLIGRRVDAGNTLK